METAFTSFDGILTQSWIRTKKFGAKTAEFFHVRPERFLSTSLIGSNTASVAYSTIFVIWASDAGISETAIFIISPVFLLVFGEVFPKVIAYALANSLVRFASQPLYVFYYLFSPVRWLLNLFTRQNKKDKNKPEALRHSYFFIKDELNLILKGAEEAGAAKPEEGELLSKYLDARELSVKQIMTPRTEMIAVNVKSTPFEARGAFAKYRHRILPVYEDTVDHIVGYIRAKDFLYPRETVQDAVKPMLFVPESKNIVELLEEFRRDLRHAAIVIDEHGGTDGIVTIKDIFEEIVGPVAERWDPSEPAVKKIANGKYLVSGNAFLEDIAEETGWTPPEGDYTTLSGLLADYLGRIAKAGEEIEIESVKIRVIRGTPTHVQGCLLKIPQQVISE